MTTPTAPTDRRSTNLYNFRIGRALGISQLRTRDGEAIDDGMIDVNGKLLVNLGNCSYLGLGADLRLKTAAIEAVRRAGTSFASSPQYVALDMYDTLIDKLTAILGGNPNILIGASTTLTHLGTLPVLAEPDHLVLCDRSSHASLQLALKVVQAQGTEVRSLPHNDMNAVRDQIHNAGRDIKQIWYVSDSVYSMYGDTAPFGDIRQLQEADERLWVYYDDAHGFSWTGEHGEGFALREVGHHPRQIVAVSLNKSFGASGGAVLVPDEEIAELVTFTGPTFTFSGPIPPAGLGAAIESGRLHLSDERDEMEKRLQSLFDVVREVADDEGLILADRSDTPVWFLHVSGGTEGVGAMSWLLLQEGYFNNPSVYPVVPRDKGGIRFNTTLYQSPDDVERFVRAFGRLGRENNLLAAP